jgi:hypothetical protein
MLTIFNIRLVSMVGKLSRFHTFIVVIVVALSFSAASGVAEAANGSLLIKVVPRGAEVLINNNIVGKAPVLVDNLRPGRVRVQARLPGYRSWGKNVMVLEMEKNVVTLILSRSLRE